MLLQLYVRNDGISDEDLRDGDIFATKTDAGEAILGDQEKKSYLFVKLPDPANVADLLLELVKSEYAPGPGEFNEIRRMRKYRVDWRPKFTSEEIAIIEDATQIFGTGVVENRFTIGDVSRK